MGVASDAPEREGDCVGYAHLLAHSTLTDVVQALDLDSTNVFFAIRKLFNGRDTIHALELLDVLAAAAEPCPFAREARGVQVLRDELLAVKRTL